MKKIIVFLCMLTCVFGLAACGSDPVYNEYEQEKLQAAESNSVNTVLYLLDMFSKGGNFEGALDYYNAEEVEYVVEQSFQIKTDGYAFKSAIEAYDSAKDAIGGIKDYGDITSSIDDDTIIVDVELIGEKKNARAEFIYSNDLFLKLESVSVIQNMTFGELMGKAGLNTLIGMGTVFAVLLFISFIISLFKYIPKIQESFTKKKGNTGEAAQSDISRPEDNEAQSGVQTVEESDDLELVAVIAAAVAAFEGQTSTDGFVVRSIRRRIVG